MRDLVGVARRIAIKAAAPSSIRALMAMSAISAADILAECWRGIFSTVTFLHCWQEEEAFRNWQNICVISRVCCITTLKTTKINKQ